MIDQNSNQTPFIHNFGESLKYAFNIARAANGHANYALIGTHEPREAYRFTQELLGQDTQIIDEADIQAYYRGRGTRSLELSAALEVAIGVFAQKIVEVFEEPDPKKRMDLKREFRLYGVFPGEEEELKSVAEQTINVSDEIANFLAHAENREQMRQRFPDAGLSDELINRVMPAPV